MESKGSEGGFPPNNLKCLFCRKLSNTVIIKKNVSKNNKFYTYTHKGSEGIIVPFGAYYDDLFYRLFGLLHQVPSSVRIICRYSISETNIKYTLGISQVYLGIYKTYICLSQFLYISRTYLRYISILSQTYQRHI